MGPPNFFGGVVLRKVFLPSLFSTLPWRPPNESPPALGERPNHHDHDHFRVHLSAAAFWGFFARGFSRKCLRWRGNFWKKFVRFAGENHLRTQRKTHKTKLCAEVPERPLPKERPLFSAAESRRAPFFYFGVPLDAASNAPSAHWKTEKRQRFFIWCVIRCRFDAASEAKLAKNLAPYRIGKHPDKQNRAKIHQKIPKIVFFEYFWCIFGLFWGLLCFPIL